jgi:hypothetical protein
MITDWLAHARLRLGLGLAAAALAVGCTTTPAPMSISDAIEVNATVDAIDYSTRMVTLRDARGTHVVQAGPEVVNLPQVKVGDRVVVRYIEALGAEVKKPGTGVSGVQTEVVGARAEPGQRPGAGVATQTRTTVKIYEVDRYQNVVEFTGPSGYNRRIKVKDPKAIEFVKGLKKGDEVEVTFTEALAISVQPAR